MGGIGSISGAKRIDFIVPHFSLLPPQQQLYLFPEALKRKRKKKKECVNNVSVVSEGFLLLLYAHIVVNYVCL